MKSHPAAELNRMLNEEEFDKLAQDIEKNGLKLPILTHEGMIIDGRKRYLACLDVEVEPRFEKAELHADECPYDFVMSLSEFRRHDTPSQRSMAGSKYANAKRGRARKQTGNVARLKQNHQRKSG